jgi:hypothetical protein
MKVLDIIHILIIPMLYSVSAEANIMYDMSSKNTSYREDKSKVKLTVTDSMPHNKRIGIGLGIWGGMSTYFSTQSDQPYDNYTGKDLGALVQLNYKINNKISFCTGFRYGSRSAYIIYPYTNTRWRTGGNRYIDMSYLQLPIMMNYKLFSLNNKELFEISIGGSYLWSSNNYYNGTGSFYVQYPFNYDQPISRLHSEHLSGLFKISKFFKLNEYIGIQLFIENEIQIDKGMYVSDKYSPGVAEPIFMRFNSTRLGIIYLL